MANITSHPMVAGVLPDHAGHLWKHSPNIIQFSLIRGSLKTTQWKTLSKKLLASNAPKWDSPRFEETKQTTEVWVGFWKKKEGKKKKRTSKARTTEAGTGSTGQGLRIMSNSGRRRRHRRRLGEKDLGTQMGGTSGNRTLRGKNTIGYNSKFYWVLGWG